MSVWIAKIRKRIVSKPLKPKVIPNDGGYLPFPTTEMSIAEDLQLGNNSEYNFHSTSLMMFMTQ